MSHLTKSLNRHKVCNMKMKILFYFFLLPLSFILVSCDTNEPPSESLSLIFEDASCTEVWLKLNGGAEGNYILKRDGKQIEQISISGTDNIIYDDSLQPSTTYNYQLTSIRNQASSNQVSVVTMDTTSHDFTWETFTFGGQGGSSTLYDVAIIDENNIWAVGEIYTADDKYNAVHWDGNQWELLKVNYGGHFWSIRSVFAFNENDIWFSAYVKYDGERFIDLPIPEEITGWGINKTWGVSSSDFYVVGNGGNIGHYDGNSWEKIESGTTFNLYDIHSTNGNEIYASGGNFMNNDGILLKGDNQKMEILKEGKRSGNGELFDPYFIGIAKTVCSVNNGIYFGGNLLYRFKFGKWELVKSFEGNYPYGNSNSEHFGFISQIRGNRENDLFLIGEGNTVRHFNGSTWVQLGTEYSFSNSNTWLTVDEKEDIVVTVGRSSNEAILMVLNKSL